MILKILLLLGLARLLSIINKPLLCSGIYTGMGILFSLLGKKLIFFDLLIGAVVTFVLSSIYFWLLDRFALNLGAYFVVLVGGLFICLV